MQTPTIPKLSGTQATSCSKTVMTVKRSTRVENEVVEAVVERWWRVGAETEEGLTKGRLDEKREFDCLGQKFSGEGEGTKHAQVGRWMDQGTCRDARGWVVQRLGGFRG